MNTLLKFQKKYFIKIILILQKLIKEDDIWKIILNYYLILKIHSIKIYCLYDLSYIIFNNKLYCCTNSDDNNIDWIRNYNNLEQLNISNYYFNLINICKINEVKIKDIITISNNNNKTLVGTKKGLFIFGSKVKKSKTKYNLIKKSISNYNNNNNKDVKFIKIKDIKYISSQSNYSFIVTKNKIYGSHDFYNSKTEFNFKNINNISSGNLHTFLITNKNELYGYGSNRFHQLGIDEIEINFFKKINYLKNSYIVSCGYRHTMVLTLNDNLYGCGDNSVSQLIFETKNCDSCEIKKFKKINNKNLKNILSISCGRFHSLILTKDGLFNCGFLFYNFNMISKIYNNETIFKILPNIIANDILKISCGDHHYLLLTKKNLFIAGSTNYGELGINSHYEEEFSLNYVCKKIK